MSTIAQLITEINTNFPDNTSGAITPALLRTTCIDMLAPDNPTYATSVTSPRIVGGTAVGSALTLVATSGVGAGAESISMNVGNNGATQMATVTSVGLRMVNGTLTVGTISDSSRNGLFVGNTMTASQLGGIKIGCTFSGALTHIAGLFVEPQGSASAAFTSEWYGVSIAGPFLAAGGTSADYYGLRIADCSVVTGGGTVSGAKRSIWVEGGIAEFNGVILGGRSAASGLTFQTTSGTGTTDKFTFKRGTDGATTLMTMGLGIGGVTGGMGFNSTTLNDNAITFGAFPTAGSGMFVERTTAAGTNGTGISFNAGGAFATGTNLTGGSVTFQSGIATGSGRSDVFFYCHPPGSTGTTDTTATLTMTLTRASVVIGAAAALLTTATDGFLYIPTCAGLPTGVPTAQTGKVAMVFNTTNSRLMIYNGSWLGATTPGTFV